MIFARALLVGVAMSAAAWCHAATAGETPPPATGATETVQPAAPPSQPSVLPGGFPVIIIPGAILIGIAAALATEENDAEFPATTTTPASAP
jgi:hypothetical protein